MRPRIAACAILHKLLRMRYNVQIEGLDKIKKIDNRATLFLPNHPALIDPVLIITSLSPHFHPRPLADSDQAAMPIAKQAMRLVDPILIPDLTTYGRSQFNRVKAALNEVAGSLNKNEDVLFYPAGQIYRSDREVIGNNSGLAYLLKKAPQTRIVLVRISGLWGSCFSRAADKAPSFIRILPKLIHYLLLNWLFFGPKRKVKIELEEDTTLAQLSNRHEINEYLENYYNSGEADNQSVPYYWFQERRKTCSPNPV